MADTTAPVITVTGSNPMTVELSGNYTELGATADTGETVTPSGTVDTSTLGAYTITYTATDSAGNVGTATRTVNVVDTTAPIISLNGANVLTVELGSSYTELGATADTGETVTASGTVDASTIGTYTVNYTATDAAGNVGNLLSATQVVFLSDATWTVPSGVTYVEVLVVAGGGSGGPGPVSLVAGSRTGGGAGGLIHITNWDVSGASTLTVTVGAGGAVYMDGTIAASNGEDSIVSTDTGHLLTAKGGGHGGHRNGGNFFRSGDGGSGGGGLNTSADYRNGASTQSVNTNDQVNTYPNTGHGHEGGAGWMLHGGGAGGTDPNIWPKESGGPGLNLSASFGTSIGDDGWFASGGTTLNNGSNQVRRNNSKGGGGEGHNGEIDQLLGYTGMRSREIVADGHDNTGGGGGGCGFGGSGVVIIKYSDIAKRTVNVVDTTAPVITLNGTHTEVALTSASQISGSTTYTVTSSSNSFTNNGFNNWKVYNHEATTNGWHTTNSFSPSTLQYTGSDNLNSVNGEWNKLYISIGSIINGVQIVGRSVSNEANPDRQAPQSWEVLASTDDSSWISLHSSSTAMTYNGGVGHTETFSNTTAYNYYAILVKSVKGPNAPFCAINEIIYYGTVASGTVSVESGGSYTELGAIADGGETVTASGTVDTSTVGTYTITYTATDTAGNAGTATRTVNVVDTTAPVITVTGSNPLTIERGSNYTELGATADTGETVTPSGTVDTSTLGAYTITYTATDGAGNVGTATRTVNVIDIDTTPPVITLNGTHTEVALASASQISGSTTYTVTSSSNSFTNNGFNNWKVYNHEATTNGWHTTNSFSPSTLQYTGSDNLNSVNGEWNKLYISIGSIINGVQIVGRSVSNEANPDRQAPQSWEVLASTDDSSWISLHSSSTAMTYNGGVGHTETFSNTTAYNYYAILVKSVKGPNAPFCAINEIIYYGTVASGTVSVESGGSYTELGAIADSGETVTASGTVDTSTVGSYTITYTATDASGNVGTTTRTVNVVDTTAPVITVTGSNPLTVELSGNYTELGATADTGETVTPSGTVDTSTVGSYTITYTATDTGGNVTTATRTVNVVDTTAPVITVTGSNPLTVELSGTYTELGATADGGETVTPSGTVDTSTLGAYTITYTATDSAGNVGTATRTVNVVDTTAPVITVTGSNPLTVELSGSYTELGATADGGETVTLSGTVDTSTLGAYTITYTATDGAGNVGTATRTVNVVDTTSPVITVTGSNPMTVELSGSYTELGATADGGETVTLSGTVDTSTLGAYTITYTATDTGGNVGTATRTVNVVNVVDTTPPVVTVTGSNPITVELSGSYTELGATADTGETVTSSGTVDVSTVGTYTITYTATDTASNTGYAFRTVNVVNDTTPPVITVTGSNPTNVKLYSTYTDAGATADGGETVTTTGTVDTTTLGTYTITYTATDGAGNVGTATRSVVVAGCIPCFLKGTLIATTKGDVRVEALRAGDKVRTHDGRSVKVLFMNGYTSPGRPYEIRKGTVLNGYEVMSDLYLSDEHAVLVDEKTLTRVKHLGFELKKGEKGEIYEYYHITTPNFYTDVIMANGLPCETFGNRMREQCKGNNELYEFMRSLLGKVLVDGERFSRLYVSPSEFTALYYSTRFAELCSGLMKDGAKKGRKNRRKQVCRRVE